MKYIMGLHSCSVSVRISDIEAAEPDGTAKKVLISAFNTLWLCEPRSV